MISRRTFWTLAPAMVALARRPALAEDTQASDRGLGGTGVAPTPPSDGDRGIGGTGVVGTIRRFGSIVVNDLRITFPASVTVMVDDRKVALSTLRLGHVVHVLAHGRSGRWSTGRIVADSEVVGPIEALDKTSMLVLGQEVDLPKEIEGPAWRIGDIVAVSGLRRLDGTIVASLVEPRPDLPDTRVSGPVILGRDGVMRIGSLAVDGLGGDTVGQRVTVVGRAETSRFRVTRLVGEPFARYGVRPSRLSVEAFVARDHATLRLGSGMSIAAPRGPLLASAPDEHLRAVISAAVRPDGGYRMETRRIVGRSFDRREPESRTADPAGQSRTGPR